jgi:hypothetical protein
MVFDQAHVCTVAEFDQGKISLSLIAMIWQFLDGVVPLGSSDLGQTELSRIASSLVSDERVVIHADPLEVEDTVTISSSG